jgi:hypothetical protein
MQCLAYVFSPIIDMMEHHQTLPLMELIISIPHAHTFVANTIQSSACSLHHVDFRSQPGILGG